jgi:hypothetical protein
MIEHGLETTPAPWPTLKTLDYCAAGDLVRVNLGDGTTLWALKGKSEEPELVALLILAGGTANPAPYAINVTTNNAMRTRLPSLSYGRHYRLVPNHCAPCDVAHGAVPGPLGALIISDAGRFLRAELHRTSTRIFYNVDNGSVSVHNIPFSIVATAAISAWSIWLDPPDGSLPPFSSVSTELTRQFCIARFSTATPANELVEKHSEPIGDVELDQRGTSPRSY